MEEGTAIGYYRFEPVADSTKVTRVINTDMGSGVLDKYMGLMMDSWVGSSFEDGLANLEEVVRNLPADTGTVLPDSTQM